MAALLFIALFCCFDDLFAVIVATFRAYVMRHFRLVALRAGYEARGLEFPVSAALIATGFGSFTLWYCHVDFHLRSKSYSLLVKSTQWVDAEWIHFT